MRGSTVPSRVQAGQAHRPRCALSSRAHTLTVPPRCSLQRGKRACIHMNICSGVCVVGCCILDVVTLHGNSVAGQTDRVDAFSHVPSLLAARRSSVASVVGGATERVHTTAVKSALTAACAPILDKPHVAQPAAGCVRVFGRVRGGGRDSAHGGGGGGVASATKLSLGPGSLSASASALASGCVHRTRKHSGARQLTRTTYVPAHVVQPSGAHALRRRMRASAERGARSAPPAGAEADAARHRPSRTATILER